jgi:hypothetical protein
MEAIMKWIVLINVIKFKSFVGETQNLWKFISSFSSIAEPLHNIIMSGKSFEWVKNQQKDFDELKINISQPPCPTLPKFQKNFKVEIDASVYSMGVVLMQGGRHVYYHYAIFQGAALNYPTYEKELYAFVQAIKKWKHYMRGRRPSYT